MDLPIGISQCKHGVMHYLRADVIVGRCLEIYGEFSDQEVGFLEQLVAPGDLIVEVGANIGAITVPLAKRVGPEGRVIAFEPQGVICDLLRKNLAENGLSDRVTVRQNAVGAEIGTARMPAIDYAASNAHPAGASLNGSQDGEEVGVVTLDACDLVGVKVKLIKMDVEGFEAKVIEGARETIENSRPLLYVENDKPEKSEELIGLIQSLGYRMFWHLPPLYDANNFRGSQINAYVNIVSVNMLCVPAERQVSLPLIEVLTPQDDWKVAARPRERLVRAPGEGQKTVAVLRAGVYGDCLMASSAIAALKRQGYHVTFYTERHGEEVMRHDPNIDRFVWLPREEVTIADIINYFISDASRFDRTVNLTQSLEANLLAAASDLRFYWPKEAREEAFSGNYLELTHLLAGVPNKPDVRFFPTEDEKVAVSTWVKPRLPLVVVAVSGSTQPKFWPHVGEFALQMANIGINVALVGDLRGVAVEHERVHMIGTDWPMREVMTLAQMADCVIGQETGLMHAVSCEDVGKVVLLSHSTRRNLTLDWPNTVALSGAAPCYPCHRNHTDNVGFNYCNRDEATGAALCQTLISVDAVIVAMTEVMRSTWIKNNQGAIDQLLSLFNRAAA